MKRVLIFILLFACGDLMPPLYNDPYGYDEDGSDSPQIRRVADKRLPTVQVIEPREGHWTQDNSWAAKISRMPWPPLGTRIMVLSKVDFPGPPRRRTVHLIRNNEIQGEVDDGNNADLQAIVTYGVGGVVSTFTCDWVHGQAFSVPAGTLTIEAITYRPDPNNAYVFTGYEVDLGVMVDDWDSPEQPILTERVFFNVGVVSVDIPNYATEVYISKVVGSSVTAEALVKYGDFNFNIALDQWVPLGAARFLHLRQAGGPVGTGALLFWRLSP